MDAPGSVMLDIDGLALTAADKQLLERPQVGGVIFFARNFNNLAQLQSLVLSIRQLRPELLLAVDQEGGRVQRFKQGFCRIPAMQSFLGTYRQDAALGLQKVRNMGWLMASELLACDIDISFAPVLDVDDNQCSVIADRSFSPQPHEVVELAGAFIDGMREAGMATTGKHFPGHGSVSGDSHLLQPVDERNWEQIQQRDLVPFVALKERLDAVMPAHIVFPKIDELPVGFSSVWLQQKLRAEMAFDGVIFSDDLSMEGASSAGGFAARADAALAAGCDMVLVCNNRAAAVEVIDHLETTANVPSARVASMRMRRKCHWNDLRQDQRWQHLVAELQVDATI